jgi:DNA-binding MarR family transcriptional regulator
MSAAELGPGQMLFQFVRHWARRASALDPRTTAEQGRLVLVTEAVESLVRRGEAATINAIAHEIGIDQSGASRLVKSAMDAGVIELWTLDSDARRRHATVTAGGRKMLKDAHAWQEQVFDQLTDGWTAEQRVDFQRAMVSLVERSYSLTI